MPTYDKNETTNLIFMPVGIMPYLGDALTEANIPFKTHNWRTFLQTRDPYDIKPEYKAAIEKARVSYLNAEYPQHRSLPFPDFMIVSGRNQTVN